MLPTEKVSIEAGIFGKEFDFCSTFGTKPPFSSSLFVVEPGQDTGLDQHDVKEIWYIASGNALISLDGAEIELSAGQAIGFSANQVHSAHNEKSCDLVIFSIWW